MFNEAEEVPHVNMVFVAGICTLVKTTRESAATRTNHHVFMSFFLTCVDVCKMIWCTTRTRPMFVHSDITESFLERDGPMHMTLVKKHS